MAVRAQRSTKLLAGLASVALSLVGTVLWPAPAAAGGTASIADAAVVEGTGGSTTLVFTVTSSALVGDCSFLRVTVSGATAVPGSDYTDPGFLGVYFPSGPATTRTVSVTVVPDALDEHDETVTATLSNAGVGACAAATISDASAVGTIVDDDTATASIDDVSHTEGSPPPAGFTDYGFTVSLSTPSSVATSVNYAVAHGSTDAADFGAGVTAGTVAFAAGETAKTALVRVQKDTLNEADEVFSVLLSGPSASPPGPAPAIGDGSGTGMILNDDAGTSLSVANASVTEGSPLAFAVTLAAAVGQAVSVDYATTDGTASAPGDYTATTGTLTIPAGATSGTIAVPTVSDAADEPDETLTLTLSNPVAVTITDGTATGTIRDDEGVPVLGFPDALAGAIEQNQPLVRNIRAALSSPTTTDVVLTYDVVACPSPCTGGIPATAGADFEVVAMTMLTIPAGQTDVLIPVTVLPDDLVEPTEVFTVRILSATGATVSPTASSIRVGIVNTDGVPTASIDDRPAITEGDAGASVVTFTVTLSNAYPDAMSIQFTTQDGSATAGSDYGPESGTLSFPAGTTTRTVDVSVFGDEAHELNETFDVVVSNLRSFGGVTPTLGIVFFNLPIADNRGVGTIVNDDLPAPIVSVGDAQLVEGDAGQADMVFPITLSYASDLDVSGTFSTANQTAAAGSDYLARTNAGWVIPAGSTSTTITVPVLGDSAFEPDETFRVTLAGLVNGGPGDAQATGRIVNDDVPVLSVNDPAAVVEGTGPGATSVTFTVSLNGPAQAPVSVTVSTADGTAAAPGDYNAVLPTVVDFATGEQAKTVTVPVVRDNVVEGTETFTLALSSPAGATLGDPAGTATITDDDATPAPAVSGLGPSSGPSQGGTVVTVIGANLTTATQVTIGGQPVAFAVSGANLVFTTPFGFPGGACVQVTSPGGTSACTPGSTFTFA